MPTTVKHPSDRHPGLTWAAVSGVQPVVFVARLDDRPVAILEMVGPHLFKVTLCDGTALGTYESMDAAQSSLATVTLPL